jgi:hypothetical protein
MRAAARSGRPQEAGMADGTELKPGHQVEWDTSQGTTHGEVVRKQTSETQIKGHKVAATPDEPQFIVRSAKSGKLAAHRPEELRRKS